MLDSSEDDPQSVLRTQQPLLILNSPINVLSYIQEGANMIDVVDFMLRLKALRCTQGSVIMYNYLADYPRNFNREALT